MDYAEFTAEPWGLLEALVERIKELNADKDHLAYELACKGKTKIKQFAHIYKGQDYALKKVLSSEITFIWGPPGTGKTTTLAHASQELLQKGKRILMVSYSNVSVDGALFRVAKMSNLPNGQIVRYGYPRLPEVANDDSLTSYGVVLSRHPDLVEEYKELLCRKKKLKFKDPEKVKINKRLTFIRGKIKDEEKELVQNASFVATTISKAVVDDAIYGQRFDVVIFDEASMAYVPQIVYAASLAKDGFCCLGDFRQLPAIVQNKGDSILIKDIFDYTGITSAVEKGFSHEWLVMLDYQYRMHPNIASFVSEEMYEGMLQSAENIEEDRQKIADMEPLGNEPICMLDLSSSYSVCMKTRDSSRINLMSALICLKLATLYAGRYSVGIISPYSAQARLMLAMVRDLRERNNDYIEITCATVHQFQGSERPVIIYDPVDCFRMPYPGTLLTKKENNVANRLFNVAITRTQGKFIVVGNVDYYKRKKIAGDLLFSKLMSELTKNDLMICGEDITDELATEAGVDTDLFVGARDEEDTWERFMQDITQAKQGVDMYVPGLLADDAEWQNGLLEVLRNLVKKDIDVNIYWAEEIPVHPKFQQFVIRKSYVTTPCAIIDGNIVWFGEPLSGADFISQGEYLKTEYFPCIRFQGHYTARMLTAIFS